MIAEKINLQLEESGQPVSRFWLWGILGVSLVLRLGLVALTTLHDPSMQATHNPDTARYLALANALATSGAFALDGLPELFRTPGYPVFLTLGVSAGHPEMVAVLLQALLGVLTTYLVYDIARVLLRSARCGLLAAALYALEPISLLYTVRVLSEAVFVALLAGSVSFLARTIERPDARFVAAAALLLAASAYVRPISYYLPFVLAVLLLWCVRAQSEWLGRKGAMVALFLVLAMGPQWAWQARNYVQTGYGAFSAVADVNLQRWLGAAVVADKERITISEAQAGLDRKLHRNADKVWDADEWYRANAEIGMEIIKENPLRFAKVFIRGSFINLVDPGGTVWLRHFDMLPDRRILLENEIFARGPIGGLLFIIETIPAWLIVNLALGLFVILLIGGSALGVVAGAVRREPAVLLLVSLAAYFLLLAGGLNSSRLRHPSTPWMCMLTAYGVLALDAWRRERRAPARA